MSSRGDSRRIELADGRQTTVHVVTYPLSETRIRVVRIAPAFPLEDWCARAGVRDALSGGFAVKPEYQPLGELWVDGRGAPHRPFAAPWSSRRAAIAVNDGRVSIAHRGGLAERPSGDLLQAGPLLVRDGQSAIAGNDDPEGFSTTRAEFDEDITANREPRLAVALTADECLAIAADGRTPDDAGLTLWELADLLVEFGADAALNLDGGSASALVVGGRRRNTPRTDEGEDMDASSPSVSAIVFDRR